MCNTCPKPPKIEAGKYYKTKGGKKAFVSVIVGHNPLGSFQACHPIQGFVEDWPRVCYWEMSGVFAGADKNDIIEEWREPVTKEATIYLYESGECSTHTIGYGKPIASVKAKLVEGQFAS